MKSMNMKLAAMLAMFGLGLAGCGDETTVYVDPPEQPGVTVIVYTSPDAAQVDECGYKQRNVEGCGRAIDGDGSTDRAIPETDAGIQPDAALWDAATTPTEPDQGNGIVDAAEATNMQDSATDKPTPDAGHEPFNPDMGQNIEPDAEVEQPSDTPLPDSGMIELGGDPCIYIISPDSDGDGITDACEEAAAAPEPVACMTNEECAINESCWENQCFQLYDPETEYLLEVRWMDTFSRECVQGHGACEEIELNEPEDISYSQVLINCVDAQNMVLYWGTHTYPGILPPFQSTNGMVLPQDPSVIGCFVFITAYCGEENIECWHGTESVADPMTGELIGMRQYNELSYSINRVPGGHYCQVGDSGNQNMGWWVPMPRDNN